MCEPIGDFICKLCVYAYSELSHTNCFWFLPQNHRKPNSSSNEINGKRSEFHSIGGNTRPLINLFFNVFFHRTWSCLICFAQIYRIGLFLTLLNRLTRIEYCYCRKKNKKTDIYSGRQILWNLHLHIFGTGENINRSINKRAKMQNNSPNLNIGIQL